MRLRHKTRHKVLHTEPQRLPNHRLCRAGEETPWHPQPLQAAGVYWVYVERFGCGGLHGWPLGEECRSCLMSDKSQFQLAPQGPAAAQS